MAEVPFLGCKISLISKCDIRYEGILYCVDAKESTIALSKVKSYGTEDRADPTSGSWVAPKNEVYDIIIFRASDVKDLRVDTPEPPGLSDPAIISAHQHAYPSGNGPTSSSGTLGNPAASSSTATSNLIKSNQQASSMVSSSHSSAAAAMAASARIASKQVLDAYGSPTNNISTGPAIKQQQHKPLLPFLPTGQTQQIKDSHFQLTSASSNHNQQPPINYSSAAANGQRRSRPEPREKKSTSEDSSHHNNHASSINAHNNNSNNKKLINHDRGNHHQHGDERGPMKDREDRRNNRGVSSDRRSDKRGVHGADHDHHQQRSHHYERRDDRRHREDNRQKNDDRRDDRKGSRDRRRGSSNPRVSRGYDRGSNYVSNSRPGGDRGRYNNDMRRRGPNDSGRGYRKSGDGRPPFRRGPMPANRRPRSGDRIPGQGYRGSRKSAPLKFEGEYDFDEANKEFLELEAKLKNLKLKNGNESKDGDKLSTDEPANSKSPAGDSESGSSYDSDDHHTNKNDDSNDEANGAEFYDKTKSFFDSISCEASERSSGKVGKPDWRKERQLNAETFGVSANYRRGGGYRGRVWQASSAR